MRNVYVPLLATGLLALASCSEETSFQSGHTPRPLSSDASSIRTEGDNPDLWLENFQAGIYQNTTLEFPGDFANAQQTITLQQPMTDGSQEFTQATRSVYRDEFRQGAGNNRAAERFMQNELGVLDVLLVVDNSNSMREEQQNLAARLAPLLSSINNTNWRIAITSTDPKDGCVVRVISRNDQNQEQMFSETILGLGTAGARDEVGFYQARNAIRCGNPKWMRPQANLAIIFVSDEDNCGRGNECGNYPESQPVSFLVDDIAQTHVLGRDAKIHGILWQPGTTCNTGGFEANLYAEAIRQAKGKIGSICSNDYSGILSDISKDMSSTLKTQVELKNDPVAGTLTVLVNGQDYTAYVQVIGKILYFTKTPPIGATIDVNYYHANVPVMNEFTLPRDQVDTGTLSVTVNNQTMGPNDYSYDAQRNKIVFSGAPAANAQIIVEYKRFEKYWRELVLQHEFAPETIKITINNEPTTDFAYDSLVKKIVFKTPPPDGAKVVLTYKRLEDPILTYPFTADFADAHNVRAVWQDAPDQYAPITYQNQTITLDRTAFKRGRVIVVQYQNAIGSAGTITLPQTPEGDYTIDIQAANCRREDFSINGHVLTANCKIVAGERVAISYRYLASVRQSFPVPEFTADSSYVWQVFVDGQEIKDFTRTAGVVTVQHALAPTDVVTIRAVKRNF